MKWLKDGVQPILYVRKLYYQFRSPIRKLDWDQIARGCLQSLESTEFSEDAYIDRKCVGQTDRAKVSKLFMSCDFRTSPFEWLQIRNQQQALRNTVNLARIKNISFEIHEVALYVHHNGEASK